MAQDAPLTRVLDISIGNEQSIQGESTRDNDILSRELENVGELISSDELIEANREVDTELHNMIKNEVDGALLETTRAVAKKHGSKLTQELVTKINDRANVIGRAYLMKKVLINKKKYYDALHKLARGGVLTETIETYDKDGELQYKVVKTKEYSANINAIKYLFGRVDGSNPIAIVKEERKQSQSIDDIITDVEEAEVVGGDAVS